MLPGGVTRPAARVLPELPAGPCAEQTAVGFVPPLPVLARSGGAGAGARPTAALKCCGIPKPERRPSLGVAVFCSVSGTDRKASPVPERT